MSQQGFDFDVPDAGQSPQAKDVVPAPASGVREPADAAQRRRALDPGRSFLVQAPAGSGKTELLTDRILALLATVQRPEEIVAITFTRRAASEMHARVLDKLRSAASGVAPSAPHLQASWRLARQALERDAELDWQLLRHPARLAIQTIDSFCARLVRSMPWLSELGGMPDIAENAWSHYEAAALATLGMAGEEEAVRRLLAHMDVDVAAAVEAVASMLAQRDQWMPLLGHGLDREGQQDTLARFISADIEAVARRMPRGWEQALAPAARLAAAALDENGPAHKLAALRDWLPPLACDASQAEAWKALADLLLTGEGSPRSPRGLNKNLGCPPKSEQKEALGGWLDENALHASTWAPALAALRELPPAHFSDAQWEVLEAQWRVLRLAAAQLRVRFAEAGEVDFVEIAQRAQTALGDADDPGELLLKLDAVIRHLLIDEFQDTSQSQVRLLAALTSGWTQDDGRTLFLVGDPMQSIYRFRKAEVGLFLQVRDHGIGELQPEFLNLTDNFRSQQGVVEWVNQRFGMLLPTRDQENPDAGAVAYTPSVAFNPPLPGRAVRFHAAWGEDAAQADAAALEAVVPLVREALADAQGAHSVAVLVRARPHLGDLVRVLSRAGIGCRAVELVPLAQRHVVGDLVQLVRALVHPGDRLAWLSVLRAPWAGLTLDTLARLFGSRHDRPVPAVLRECLAARPDGAASQALAQIPDEERERLLRVATVLLDDGNDNGALPWSAWVESLWRRLGGARLYAGSSAAEDAESVFVLLEKLAPYGDPDLVQLDAALARLFASGQPEPGTGPVVEVMTMHKSKGLQFDTVILYGLHRVPRASSTPLLSFEHVSGEVLFGPAKPRAQLEPDPLSRYIGRREKVRGDYEIDRLLYVAATRARQRLHLVGNVLLDESGNVRTPAGSSLLGRLWPLLEEQDQVPPADLSVAQPVQDGSGAAGALLQRIAYADMLGLPVPVADQDDAQGQEAQGGAGPAAPVGEGVQWGEDEGRQAAIGTLVHAWLTRIGQDGVDAWPVARLQGSLGIMARQLSRAGTRTVHAPADAREVLDILLATLGNERGRWLLQRAAAHREWPLLDASGKVSILDLAFEEDGAWLIVDYKTGMPWPGEDKAAFAQRMRGRYAAQMQRYLGQVTALTRSAARAALYFPRLDLWLDMGAAEAGRP